MEFESQFRFSVIIFSHSFKSFINISHVKGDNRFSVSVQKSSEESELKIVVISQRNFFFGSESLFVGENGHISKVLMFFRNGIVKILDFNFNFVVIPIIEMNHLGG